MQDGHMRGAGVRTGKKESMLAGYSVEKGAANGMMDKVNAFQSILSKVVPEGMFKSDQGKKDAQAEAPEAQEE